MNKQIDRKRPRICIYCPYCYPIFDPKFRGHFGGWEVRVSLIAKELAKRGDFDVTLLVADHGQPQVAYREGVRLVSWIGKEFWTPPVHDVSSDDKNEQVFQEEARKPFFYGLKTWLFQHVHKKTLVIFSYLVRSLFRFVANLYWGIREAVKILLRSIYIAFKELIGSTKQVLHLWRNIWGVIGQNASFIIWRKDIALLEQVDADIYIVPGNHSMSAITASFCETRGKKYIFLAGSEMDYYPEFRTHPDRHDIYGEPYYLKAYAIEHAHLHIVQTQHQADMLQRGFQRSAQIIRNPIDLSCVNPRVQDSNKILWVGTSDERVKRPALVFELARLLPDFSFVIVMKCLTKDDVFANAQAAQRLPNVDLKFDVPFAEIEKFFADAKLFVNTSAFEGFPNTFLQAAKYGVPIIATDVDPGEMLSQYGGGLTCGGDFERFVEGVRNLMTDDRLYAKMNASVLEYVRTYHNKDIIIPQYERAFHDILDI